MEGYYSYNKQKLGAGYRISCGVWLPMLEVGGEQLHKLIKLTKFYDRFECHSFICKQPRRQHQQQP